MACTLQAQTLRIDYFPLNASTFSKAHRRRALEAEITFQFRLAHRGWPLRMSEIHFLERYREHKAVVALASRVLTFYGHTYNTTV